MVLMPFHLEEDSLSGQRLSKDRSKKNWKSLKGQKKYR